MPWKQGESGNPNGRPRKSQRSMAQLRSQISEHLPDVIEVLANAAKEGDVQAARILVERCVPSMRALDQNINVNDSVDIITSTLGFRPARTYSGGDRGWVGDSPFICLDCTRMRSLGWSPRHSIRDGIIKTVTWLQSNSWVYQ